MVPKGHILEKKYLHGSLKHCISDIAYVTFHYSHYIREGFKKKIMENSNKGGGQRCAISNKRKKCAKNT